MKKTILIQCFVLVGGTLFAWFNFIRELAAWRWATICIPGCGSGICNEGCPTNVTNPFLTPCFWGAVFFTIALLLNLVIFQKSREISK